MGKETLTLTLHCDLHWSEISKAIFSNKKSLRDGGVETRGRRKTLCPGKPGMKVWFC